MWHTGDDIAIVSFKSKMHAIGEDVLDGVMQAIDEAERGFKGVIIWQTEPPFSRRCEPVRSVGQARRRCQALRLRLDDEEVPARGRVRGAEGGAQAERRRCADGGPAGEGRAHRRAVPGHDPGLEVCDGAHRRGSGRPGAGRRLRVRHALALAPWPRSRATSGWWKPAWACCPAGGGCKELALRAAADAKGGDLFPFLRRYFRERGQGRGRRSRPSRRASWVTSSRPTAS